jgi:hypothetical protein
MSIEESGELQIIPCSELKLIPLYPIITHIYEKIIEKASLCEVSYAFNIDKLIKKYELNSRLSTHSNNNYIINEIKRLFPGISITEIREQSNYVYYLACWEDEQDDSDEIMLSEAIQLSMNEAKYPEISIMGQRAEERLQQSRAKYKKLYK